MIASIGPADMTIRISRTEEIRVGDIKTSGQARLLLIEVETAISKLEHDLQDSVCLTKSARAWRRRTVSSLTAKRACRRRLQTIAASLASNERQSAHKASLSLDQDNAHARRKAFIAIVTERFEPTVVNEVWAEVHRRCPVSFETGKIEA